MTICIRVVQMTTDNWVWVSEDDAMQNLILYQEQTRMTYHLPESHVEVITLLYSQQQENYLDAEQ
jgi:hypothetical protein